MLYSRHLTKEWVHTKQKEALFHPIHGAVVELIATGCCGGLKHKRGGMMPWRRGAYQTCLAQEAPKPLTDRSWMGMWRAHAAVCCFLALPLSIFHWPLQDMGYQARWTFDLHQYSCWLNQLPPTSRALLINRWAYAPSYASRQMAKPSKGLTHAAATAVSKPAPQVPAQPPFIQSLSAWQICRRERAPPTQASFRWVGEKIA